MQTAASVHALYLEIGRGIHRLRTQRRPKMNQDELAEVVGLSRASIANIERGHHRVQLHVLYDIAMALEVQPHDLLPHSDRQESPTMVPADLSKELNPTERVAIDRLLKSIPSGESNRGKP
jgi:transcriptional regulator with XRE-family HTH domain